MPSQEGERSAIAQSPVMEMALSHTEILVEDEIFRSGAQQGQLDLTRERSSPIHDAQAEHVQVLPQVRSSLPPREDHASNLVGPVRSKKGLLGRRRPFRAHAEHAPEGLVNPAVAWATLGAHVVNARGARGALEWRVIV